MAACTARVYPKMDDAMLTKWRGLSYHRAGFRNLFYIDDIPAADIKAITAKTQPSRFMVLMRSRPEAAGTGLAWNAVQWPNLAFKDMAIQVLGNLFEYELGAVVRSLGHSGRHLWRHRQRGGIRHARQEGRARVHAVAHGRMSPLPAGADVQPTRPNIHNPGRGRCV